MRNSWRSLRLPVGTAILAFMITLGSFVSARPALAQDGDDAWAPVTIVYTSDVKGHIEPCG